MPEHVDVYSTVIGGEAAAEAVAASDAKLGLESGRTSLPAGYSANFVDWPFTSEEPDVDAHLETVAEHRPEVAVAPDVEDAVLLDDAISVADRLAGVADHVVVVPKSVPPTKVPDRYRVGLPLSEYGSDASWQWTDYRENAELHLLGGSPTVQLEVGRYLSNVESVDTASVFRGAEMQSIWAPSRERYWHPVPEVHGEPTMDYYERVRISLDNIVEAWRALEDGRPGEYTLPRSVESARKQRASERVDRRRRYHLSGARGAEPTIDSADLLAPDERADVAEIDWVEERNQAVADAVSTVASELEQSDLQRYTDSPMTLKETLIDAGLHERAAVSLADQYEDADAILDASPKELYETPYVGDTTVEQVVQLGYDDLGIDRDLSEQAEQFDSDADTAELMAEAMEEGDPDRLATPTQEDDDQDIDDELAEADNDEEATDAAETTDGETEEPELVDDREQQEALDVGEAAARTADREGETVTSSEEFVDDRDDQEEEPTEQTGLESVEEEIEGQADLSGKQAAVQSGREWTEDEDEEQATADQEGEPDQHEQRAGDQEPNDAQQGDDGESDSREQVRQTRGPPDSTHGWVRKRNLVGEVIYAGDSADISLVTDTTMSRWEIYLSPESGRWRHTLGRSGRSEEAFEYIAEFIQTYSPSEAAELVAQYRSQKDTAGDTKADLLEIEFSEQATLDVDGDGKTETTVLGFGSREMANHIRDQLPDGATTDRFDRRHKSIEVYDGADVDVDQLIREAADTRVDEASQYGQRKLTDEEREQLEQRDNWSAHTDLFHARSVKALMREGYGVDDWLSWYDPTLQVDEHHGIAERARREDRGRRFDEPDRDADAQLGEQLAADRATVKDEGCEHAKEGCEEGYEEACEMLVEECGWPESEAEQLQTDMEAMSERMDELDTADGGQPEDLAEIPLSYDEEMPPAVRGIVGRAWRGYRAAAQEAEAKKERVEEYRQAREEAREYGAVINEIRGRFGQDPILIEAEVEGEPIGLNDLPAVEWESEDASPTAADEPGADVTKLESALKRVIGDVYDPVSDV